MISRRYKKEHLFYNVPRTNTSWLSRFRVYFNPKKITHGRQGWSTLTYHPLFLSVIGDLEETDLKFFWERVWDEFKVVEVLPNSAASDKFFSKRKNRFHLLHLRHSNMCLTDKQELEVSLVQSAEPTDNSQDHLNIDKETDLMREDCDGNDLVSQEEYTNSPEPLGTNKNIAQIVEAQPPNAKPPRNRRREVIYNKNGTKRKKRGRKKKKSVSSSEDEM